ncbi:GNAT family N-acetyltransferase [Azospirillum sp. A39]|uniref:GNAT family N-acetyltransferase n=1 Tax=Azospirillum sp. A39 TaxID=3462279 RepID=UPI004045B8AA
MPPRSVTGTAGALSVRSATADDAAALQAIYAHHVLNGLASFEVEPPGTAEMEARRRSVVERGMPYLVAEREGAVLGYAYVGPYRLRPAYRWTVENSIYVRADCVGSGVGRRLLGDLLDEAERRGFRQIIAVIGDSGNRASIGLHASLGFEPVGVLRAVGFKFGRWVDSVLMQRDLGDGSRSLPPG